MRHVIILSGGLLLAMNQVVHADPFGFDRPGDSLGTAIVPKGHLAWEQSIPTLSYDSSYDNGTKNSQLTIQGDVLLRLGIGHDVELRLGWDGPVWQRNRNGAEKTKFSGSGDINVGIKKAMQTNDDRLNWAVMAQATLATASKKLAQNDIALASSKENIYSLVSAIDYQYNDYITTGITMQYDYQNHDLAWAAIPNIQYKISDKVTGFAEYKYRKQESVKKESVINNGLVWAVKDNLQFDASIGYSFNDRNPEFTAGLGVAYLF